jgi:Peptide methionine sulfoxide reductase
MQDLIRKLDGVTDTRVGYTGGDVPNATYRNHGTHAEAIEILFDPDRITYRDLLEFFFQIHDPTTKNRLPRRRKHAPGPATEVLAPMRINGNALPRRRPVPRHPGIYYRPRPGGKVALRTRSPISTPPAGAAGWSCTDALDDAEAKRAELRLRRRRGERIEPVRKSFEEHAWEWLERQPEREPERTANRPSSPAATPTSRTCRR